jgi:hypothetical protein
MKPVKGSEFLRKALDAGARCWKPQALYVGDRFTLVKDLKKELGTGLLADMCKQLDIRKEDL